jgi:hypothetical protein
MGTDKIREENAAAEGARSKAERVKTAHRVSLDAMILSHDKVVWQCEPCLRAFTMLGDVKLPLCCPYCGVWYDTMPTFYVQALANSEDFV